MPKKLLTKFYDHPDQPQDVHSEIIQGLSQKQKSIAPKFFYDERGSELFRAITRTEEYYLTRTEIGLLEAHSHEFAEYIGEAATLIEYGSGNSEKIRTLLESIRPKKYVPLDISREYLTAAANSLARDYPWLQVHAACVDYSQTFELPFTLEGNLAGFFPGSSIGNFTPEVARDFLLRVKAQIGAGGGLLIGVDFKKDAAILNQAYNDSTGITAEFNLNVLAHLNRTYGGNFDLTQFSHLAFYNAELGCIQMFIESVQDQVFRVAGQSFSIGQGELIHTENSYKYSYQEFTELCQSTGFDRHRFWTDDNNWFGIFYIY